MTVLLEAEQVGLVTKASDAPGVPKLVLMAVEHCGAMEVNEMEEKLGIDHSSVDRAVEECATAPYLEKTRYPQDPRKSMVYLSDKGRKESKL